MGCVTPKKGVNVIQPSNVGLKAASSAVPDQQIQNIYIITDSNLKVDINKFYELKQTLGTGQFGIVKLGISKLGNQQKVAIKSVIKERVKEELKNLQRELTILKSVDHPNIIKLFEVYEDDKHLHIVMEYCQGGELFNRLEKKGRFSEKESALLMRRMFHAINHLHILNIAHRDLKPENCLFDSNREDAEIKLVDFGLASRFNKEKGMSSVVGTPYYVAPEIINGNYGPECDLWSLGVILHTMLVGYPPFRGDNRNDIFKKVLKGKYSLKEKEFENISVEGKELIRKLLLRDTKKRITALQAMEDPWFIKMLPMEFNLQVEDIIIHRLHEFKSSSRLRIEMLKVMVMFLTGQELRDLITAYRSLDKDYSGYISIEELGIGMANIGLRLGTLIVNGEV